LRLAEGEGLTSGAQAVVGVDAAPRPPALGPRRPRAEPSAELWRHL